MSVLIPAQIQNHDVDRERESLAVRLLLPVVSCLLTVTVAANALACYGVEIAGMTWTPDRLAAIILLPATVLFSLFTLRKSLFSWLCATCLLVSVMPAYLLNATDKDLFWKYLPHTAYCYMLFVPVFILWKKTRPFGGGKMRAWRIAAVLLELMAAYSLYAIYVSGETITDVPFRSWIPFELSDPSMHYETVSLSSNRIFLPFSTPPALGMVAGFFALYFVMAYVNAGKKCDLFHSLAMGSVCLLTISRSGIFATCVGMLVLIWFGMKMPDQCRKRLYRLSRWAMVLMLSGSISFGGALFADKEFGRLFDGMDSENNIAHWQVRVIGLQTYLDGDFTSQLVGVGLGDYRRATRHASAAHMSFLTILVERGIFGFLLANALMLLLPVIWLRRVWLYRRLLPYEVACAAISIQIFIANLLYELHQLAFLWIMLGWIASATWAECNDGKQSSFEEGGS